MEALALLGFVGVFGVAFFKLAIGQPGHHGLGALKVAEVDPIHDRLDGGQIGLQHLKFGVISFGGRAGRRNNWSYVGVGHAGESTVDRCLPR